MNRKAQSPEQKMEHLHFLDSKSIVTNLSLADGSSWSISGGDEMASFIVSVLMKTMQLRRPGDHTKVSRNNLFRRMLVLTDYKKKGLDGKITYISSIESEQNNQTVLKATALDSYTGLPPASEGKVICVTLPGKDKDNVVLQLLQVTAAIPRDVQFRGGILIHGALVARNHHGVILAGPGNVGKTTACARLPRPWRTLCDDATLIVRDRQGLYWAHPWPSWSKFMLGGSGGTWDVQKGIPLSMIFFLVQNKKDHTERVSVGQAICLLSQSVEQVSWLLSRRMGKEQTRFMRLQRFNNICELAKVISCYILHFSLTGKFWHEVERIIANPEGTTQE